MGLNPNGPMTLVKALQLREAHAADLAEAHAQRHAGWIRTLTWRAA